MKKCECYHAIERTLYNPYTPQRYSVIDGECWGTKEKDRCNCKGDKCKCDFYPYIKQKAIVEEKERKQNAKQKDNNLKHIKESLEFYLDSHEENGVVYIPKFMVEKIIEELK